MRARLEYRFSPAAESGFSPRPIVRSAGGGQRGGQLPAGGAALGAAVVSRRAQETGTLHRKERAKNGTRPLELRDAEMSRPNETFFFFFYYCWLCARAVELTTGARL